MVLVVLSITYRYYKVFDAQVRHLTNAEYVGTKVLRNAFAQTGTALPLVSRKSKNSESLLYIDIFYPFFQVPLVVIIVTYTIILLTIRRKSREDRRQRNAAAANGGGAGAGGIGSSGGIGELVNNPPFPRF